MFRENSKKEELPKQELMSGSTVRIVRSDGTPELDWQVASIENDEVTVFKNQEIGTDSAGHAKFSVASKKIPLSELIHLQKTIEIGNSRKMGPKEKVNIFRTSGKFENDWTLTDFDEKNALVEKTVGKKEIRKIIPIDELKEWQEDKKIR